MKHLHATIVVLSSLLLGNAYAQTANSFTSGSKQAKAPANNYIGASVAQGTPDGVCGGLSSCRDDDKGWKAYSGVRLNDSIVLEGGYITFGDLTAYDSNNNRVTSELSGYTTAGVATYQYSDQIELFGKAGMLWWDNETSGSNGTTTNDGSATFLGVGASYDMGDNLGIRAEWESFEGVERFQGISGSMELLSVGVTMSSL